jgi:hypothetical protein
VSKLLKVTPNEDYTLLLEFEQNNQISCLQYGDKRRKVIM